MSDEVLWVEKPSSGRAVSEPLGVQLEYTLRGPISYSDAMLLSAQLLPPAVSIAGQVAYRQNIDCEPAGWVHWDIVGHYGPRNNLVNSYTFGFDSTGGTLRITHAKEDVANFPAGGPDVKGAIDVQRDGEVRGAEIVIPATKFTYDFRFPSGAVNELVAIGWSEYIGTTNTKLWHHMKPGEALLLAARGRGGTDQETTISFEVAYSKNLTNATIGAITGVNKKGWEIAWTAYKDAVDGGKPVVQPERIYVQRVYDTADFAAVLGF